MTKESLILVLLVGAAAVGIMYAIKKASGNEDDWARYNEVRLGESYSSVRQRFSAASDDFRSTADARDAGYASQYYEATQAGAVRMFIVPSREDAFMFGFDKDDRLIYKNFRDQ